MDLLPSPEEVEVAEAVLPKSFLEDLDLLRATMGYEAYKRHRFLPSYPVSFFGHIATRSILVPL